MGQSHLEASIKSHDLKFLVTTAGTKDTILQQQLVCVGYALGTVKKITADLAMTKQLYVVVHSEKMDLLLY